MSIERRESLAFVTILCGLALLAAYAFRALLTPGIGGLPGRDAGNLYVWEMFTRSVLATGQLPFWNPFHFAGTPHLADPQTLVLYPPAVLLRWLPLLTFFPWLAVIHVWLGGAGTLFLGRVIGLGWVAASAAAVAVTLGGSVGPWLHNGHLLVLFSAAWLPWGLALAIVSARRQTIWPHPFLVVVLVLQFLAAYLQGSIYAVAAVSLYFVFSAIWPDGTDRRASRWRPLGQLAMLGVLTVGVSAFQLLPTLRLISEAGRSSGIPYAEALEGGWSLRHLATFFFPFLAVPLESPHRYLVDAVGVRGLGDDGDGSTGFPGSQVTAASRFFSASLPVSRFCLPARNSRSIEFTTGCSRGCVYRADCCSWPPSASRCSARSASSGSWPSRGPGSGGH